VLPEDLAEHLEANQKLPIQAALFISRYFQES
jgi:hypothetical protein